MKNSVLLIGIDGASWRLFQPWLDSGELPVLDNIIKQGIKGDMLSTIPPESGSAWVSLSSGKNPGKHGIFNFLTDDGKLINSKRIKTDRIWNILSRNNKKSCIINIPVTYPVEEINGVIVSSFLTPPNEKIYSSPAEIMGLLNKNNYKIDINTGMGAFMPDSKETKDKSKAILAEVADILKNRYLTLMDLMENKWDFFMVNFKECDAIQHFFWGKNKILLNFFKELDSYLGNLIKKFSEKNENPYVFIVSDHGFNSSPTRSFNIKVWMQKNNIIKDKRTILQKTVPVIYKSLMKLPFFKSLFRFDKARELRESFQNKSSSSSGIFYRDEGIYIDKNKIDEKEYEDLRDKLILELNKVNDPKTGNKVFKILKKREEVYSGDFLNKAPDIIALSYHYCCVIFSYAESEMFKDYTTFIPGRHFSDIECILAVNGKDIRKAEIKENSITDICPTILHILGVPIPQDIDGEVLKDLFSHNSPLSSSKERFEDKDLNKVELEKIKNSISKLKI